MEGVPIIMARENPCVLCNVLHCVKACKTGALATVKREKVAMGVAKIDKKKCSAWGGLDCQICSLRCPLSGEAIVLDDFKPVIKEDKCTGCGVCEQACLTVNNSAPIRVIPARQWSILKRRNSL
jgi:ferredoxin-type protein NapG